MFNYKFTDLPDELVLNEYIKRKGVADSINIREPLFHKQNAVLNDRASRFRAINTTRRGAKSTTEAMDHVEICLEYPNSRTVYFGLTIGSVREIIWDVFKGLNEKHNLSLVFNETDSIIRYPNGSRTRLFGLDSSPRELAKVLGQKLRKVSIDEAGSMNIDLESFVNQKLRPALADLRPQSWVTLLGTCENIPNTYFEKVTTGKDPTIDWSIHRWTTYDNPFMKDQWTAELKEMTDRNPDIVKASWFRTHYLNEWCSDDDLLIIPAQKMQFVDTLPHARDWYYVLGVDLGFNDASSYSIVAASHEVKSAFVVYSNKETEQDFTDVANEIKRLKEKYPISRLIVDGANKQGIEEMKHRMGLPEIEIAEKLGKATYLRLLKDDVITGALKFIKDSCNPLEEEWKALQWLQVRGEIKEVEDPRCQNHCFTGEMLVKTIFGNKKIKDVKKGDFVLTRVGYREVLKTHEHIASETMWINNIECTPSHRFISNNSNIEAQDLTLGSRLDTVWQWEKRASRSSLTVVNTEGTQILAEEPTGCTILLTQKQEKDTYIGIFGKILSVIYLMAFIFTTKMRIPKIIALKTLNVFQQKNTHPTTSQKKESKKVWKQLRLLSQKLQNGIPLKKELSGIEVTGKHLSEAGLEKKKIRLAFAVELLLKHLKLIMQKFVQINATQSFEGTQVLIILSELVRGVKKSLLPISMQKESRAHLVVHHISPIKKEPKKVYNLSVDGLHEYSVNGVFVLNCSDSALYAWRQTYSYMAELPKPIYALGTLEYFNELSTRMEEYDENSKGEDHFFENYEAIGDVEW